MLQVGLGPHGRNWARHVVPAIREVQAVGYVDKDDSLCNAVDIRGRMPQGRSAARIRPEIVPTDVVCHEHNDVWF